VGNSYSREKKRKPCSFEETLFVGGNPYCFLSDDGCLVTNAIYHAAGAESDNIAEQPLL
jgi:hypothetical protein